MYCLSLWLVGGPDIAVVAVVVDDDFVESHIICDVVGCGCRPEVGEESLCGALIAPCAE